MLMYPATLPDGSPCVAYVNGCCVVRVYSADGRRLDDPATLGHVQSHLDVMCRL